MADIELVIKISEKTYKDIQSRDWKNAERWFSEEWKAIHNGIPLPKGHGALIDVDKIIGKIHGVRSITAVLDAPIIIGADKEQEDNGFFDEIMDNESDGEVYEKIKEIIVKEKEQEDADSD